MKRFVVVVVVLFLSLISLAQGIVYKGELKMEVPESQTSKEDLDQTKSIGLGPFDKLEFDAMAQGGKFKMVYLNDFAIFKKGTYILGDASTQIAYFVFPDTQSYWEMNIDEMGKAGQSLQKTIKMNYSNQSVSVTSLPPKVINALPCTGKRIEISYDVNSSIMGIKSKSHTKQVTDYYSSTAYDVVTLFGGHNWHNQGFSIGDPVFDKEISAKIGFLGFPVQVITETWNDGKYNGKSILTTKDVHLTVLSPTTFSLPSGYKKEDAGFTSMLKMFGKGDSKESEELETKKEEQGEEGKKTEKEEKSNKVSDEVVKEGKKVLKNVIKKIVK